MKTLMGIMCWLLLSGVSFGGSEQVRAVMGMWSDGVVKPLLLGSQSIGDATVTIPPDRLFYYDTGYPTPKGQAAVATGTATNIHAYLVGVGVEKTLYGYIATQDGTVIGSGTKTINAADDGTWVTITLSLPLTITAETMYIVATGTDTSSTSFGRSSGRPETAVYTEDTAGEISGRTTIGSNDSTGSGPLSIWVN